jgi:DNA-binding CsgD family transcriptional regulator/tetratricopeptide (TPR) repeat protein
MINNDPKQALLLLDSLEKSGSLSDDERLHIVWNRALVHQALGMSLAEDEQLPEAINFYRKNADKKKDTYLMEASYLTWKGKKNDALKAIDMGLQDVTDSLTKIKLLTAKAELLESQRKYNKAIEVLKKVLKYDLPKRNEALINYKMGLNLSLLGDKESQYFYEKGAKLSVENDDTAMACEILRNYADYLANNAEYRRSNDMYYQIGQMMPQILEMSSIQMAMAGNYINLHKLDSARICNDKASRCEAKLEATGTVDIARRVVIEQERYLLNYANGQNISYVDFARYCDSITTDMQAKENTLAIQREAKNRLMIVNNELKLEQQRMAWILFMSVLLLIVGSVGGYYYYWNRVRQLADAEDRVDTLTRMLAEAQIVETEPRNIQQENIDDDVFFKKILLQQLGIIKLVASTPTNQNQALLKRISSISGGEIPVNSLLIWSDLYPVINRLYDNFYTRLMERYGNMLTEKEIQISCLLCAGFSTKEIGVITQQSDATIYVRKTSIRKKIGVAEGEDIVSYIYSVKV